MPITVSAFYKFATIADCGALRESLDRCCRDRSILGTILVAPEGINGTISGTRTAIDSFSAKLRQDARFADIDIKTAHFARHPFGRLKVKIKPEIVTLGVREADPNRAVGTYVRPADWNRLISRDDVLVVDTRNSYEFAVGTFTRAIDPGTRAFGEFPAFVRRELDPARQRRVAMFCTGGIRCEKATSYLLSLGFEEVFHLEGGVLKYLEEIPESESLWRGDCFVFDDRIAVGHGLTVSRRVRCPGCGQPLADRGRSEADSMGPCPACSPHRPQGEAAP